MKCPTFILLVLPGSKIALLVGDLNNEYSVTLSSSIKVSGRTAVHSRYGCCCPIITLKKSAACSLSLCGGINNLSSLNIIFCPTETDSRKSLFLFPAVFIRTNLTGFSGVFIKIASHINLTVLVTSLRGFPNTPLNVILCPRQEATA